VSLLVYHSVCFAVAVWLSYKVGGPRLAVVTVTVLLMLERSFGEDAFTRVFNPYLGVTPFLAFVLAVLAATTLSTWYGVVAVIMASLAIQSQAAFAGPVVVVGGLGTAALIWGCFSQRRGGHLRSTVAPFALSVVVGLVCWAAPLHQEVTANSSGNLTRIYSWLGQDRPRIGYQKSIAIVARLICQVPLPLARPDKVLGLNSLEPALTAWDVGKLSLVFIALAGIGVGTRRRKPEIAWLASIAFVSVLGSVALVAGVSNGAWRETYQLLWVWVVGACVWIAIGWASSLYLSSWLRRHSVMANWSSRNWTGTAPAVVLLLVFVASALPRTYTPPTQDRQELYREPIERTVGRLKTSPGPYRVSCTGDSRSSFCASLTLALEANGVATRQDPAATFLYGVDTLWRLARKGERLRTLYVYSGADIVAPVPGATLVSGQRVTTEESRQTLMAVERLRAEPIVVSDADVAALREAKAKPFVGRLQIQVDGKWFSGDSAAEWSHLIASDTRRFVEGGGLATLYDAGLLRNRPALQRTAQPWLKRPVRDAAWLGPEVTPRRS